MSEPASSPWQIRPLREEDVPAVLEMVRELADFEHLSDQVVARETDFTRAFFGEKPAAECLVAAGEEGLAGYAIFFSTFSTFLGIPGIWLEDLYVRPGERGRGLGTRLLKAVGRLADERGAGRFEWSVLDWNHNAIQLYQKLGGKILEDWRIVRMDREAIRHLLEE